MTIPFLGDSSYYLDLYGRYVKDPNSVPADWRVQFEALDGASRNRGDYRADAQHLRDVYRSGSHIWAHIDPLRLGTPPVSTKRRPDVANTTDRTVLTVAGEKLELNMTEAASRLSAIYCGAAAIEADHLSDPAEREWLYECF